MSVGLRLSMMMFFLRRNFILFGCKMKNVFLVSLGVFRYCVIGFIVDCFDDCVVMDEFGCKLCLCVLGIRVVMFY